MAETRSMPLPERPRLVAILAGVLGALTVVILAVVGATASSGPKSAPLGAAHRAVIVSIPGLQWRDLDASETPSMRRQRLPHSCQ